MHAQQFSKICAVMRHTGAMLQQLGERDGVQGGALAACAQSAGAEVVLETTYCFV